MILAETHSSPIREERAGRCEGGLWSDDLAGFGQDWSRFGGAPLYMTPAAKSGGGGHLNSREMPSHHSGGEFRCSLRLLRRRSP